VNKGDLAKLKKGGQVSEYKADWGFMVNGVLVKTILIGLFFCSC